MKPEEYYSYYIILPLPCRQTVGPNSNVAGLNAKNLDLFRNDNYR